MKKKTLLILSLVIAVIFAVVVATYLSVNNAYNNSKASIVDTNPNFKYFAIIGSDSYINGWTPPLTRIDENFSLVDQNLQNIMIIIFNPVIRDPNEYAKYFDNYAAEARKRNAKLLVDTFLLTAGQDLNTLGTPAWQAANQWRLDIYERNKDVIYAFSTDEPANHLNEDGFRQSYINLTKRLRELFPTIGILAIEFRPHVTDHYDAEFHQYVTDIGFDAYDNYWGNQKIWLSQMEQNVPLDKKLWLVPQGYIATPVAITLPNGEIISPGVFTTGEQVKKVMEDHIQYAKSNSRYVGIIPFNWSVTMNGRNKQAIACMKEMTDPKSQYYTPGYKELIQQTVLELKAKSGIVQTTPTPTSAPKTTTAPTSTQTATATTQPVQTNSNSPVVISYSQGTKVAIKEFNCNTRKITVTVCDSSNYNGKVLTRACMVDQNGSRNFIYAQTGTNEIDTNYEKSFCGGTTGHSFTVDLNNYNQSFNTNVDRIQLVTWDINTDGSTNFNKPLFPDKTIQCQN